MGKIKIATVKYIHSDIKYLLSSHLRYPSVLFISMEYPMSVWHCVYVPLAAAVLLIPDCAEKEDKCSQRPCGATLLGNRCAVVEGHCQIPGDRGLRALYINCVSSAYGLSFHMHCLQILLYTQKKVWGLHLFSLWCPFLLCPQSLKPWLFASFFICGAGIEHKA